MSNASLLIDARRLDELRALSILDTGPEAEFTDLASLAAAVCHSPVAAFNFVDGKRHYTKAIVGMPEAVSTSVPSERSFCARTVLSSDGVLVVPDTHGDERFNDHPLVVGGPRVGSYAGVSVTSRGERVGVLCAFESGTREYSEAELAALATLARQAEGQLELRRRNAELRELSVTDPLTGLANRTLLDHRLDAALAGRGEVGVVFCDVDEFKAVNDRHGHQAGDQVLRDVADLLRGLVRPTDLVARFAGDEFVIVCPDVAPDRLAVLARRIARQERRHVDGSPAPRVSVGTVMAGRHDDATSVLRRADLAMYADKRERALPAAA